LIGDDAEHRHRTETISAGVAAKAGQSIDLVRPICVSTFPEFTDLLGGHDAHQHRVQLVTGESRQGLPGELAVVPQHRGLAGSEVKIRSAGGDEHAEELVQAGASCCKFGRLPSRRCHVAAHGYGLRG
jgi:hypothetical protein